MIPASDLVAKFSVDFEPVWQQVIEHIDAAIVPPPGMANTPLDFKPAPSDTTEMQGADGSE